MKYQLFWVILFSCFLKPSAQPYVDPFQVRLLRAFHGEGSNATPFTHIYAGSDMPLRLNSGKLVVVSPSFENWNIDSAGNNNYLPAVSTIVLPVIFQLPLGGDKWTLQLGAIPRVNSEGLTFSGDVFQFGGIIVANYARKPSLKYRFGVYANKEFFGLFVMPLAGIDWKMNDRDYLFGLLPGRLTYEHKLSDKLYWGGNFRFVTNSYRLADGSYLRIDDNQLSAYMDCYVAKRVVITGEAGYGIFRNLRTGEGYNKNYTRDYDWGDGMFIKLNAAYRIRL